MFSEGTTIFHTLPPNLQSIMYKKEKSEVSL
jgi:hypothetical protein